MQNYVYQMYSHFEQSKNILIAGCGGGYDIFCGLDLFFNLREMGKQVVFGSYTFTDAHIFKKSARKICESCYRVDTNTVFDEEEEIAYLTRGNIPPHDVLTEIEHTVESYRRLLVNNHSLTEKVYFPEYKLCKHLCEEYGITVPIYCYGDCSIKQLISIFNEIIARENIDTIVLVDGGTDALMTGREKGALGTPYEDICSVVAAYNCTSPHKFLYCLGFNIDNFHGVKDENFFKNTSELTTEHAFVGSYMLNRASPSTQKYIETFMNCDPENSIVNSFIVAALNGHYGDYHPKWIAHRTHGVRNIISPFMTLYWIYTLEGVYKNLAYNVDKLLNCETEEEILRVMDI